MQEWGSKETRIAKFTTIILAFIWCGWTVCPVVRAADAGSDAAAWNDYVLGGSDGLKAVLHVKKTASPADADWLKFDITNNGPGGNIREFSIQCKTTQNGLYGLDLLTGVAAGIRMGSNTLPPGKIESANPSMLAACGLSSNPELLGNKTELVMTANAQCILILEDGRILKTPPDGVPIVFTWAKPTASQIGDMQKELAAFLPNSIPAEEAPANDGDDDEDFSSYMGDAENVRLTTLLQLPEVTQAITLPQVLGALKVREMVNYLPAESSNALLRLVRQRWLRDPALIAFYREALASPRGDAAISELLVMNGPWDDSFVDLLVEAAEARAPALARTRRPPYKRESAFEDIFQLLDMHYDAWAGEASIPPRLSKAILTAYPSLTEYAESRPPANPSTPGGNPVAPSPAANRVTPTQPYNRGLTLLPLTHDHAMLAVLQPFLLNHEIDNEGVLGRNRTPFRVSEVAANSIAKLLGEPEPYFGSYSNAGVSDPGPYPLWAEWDEKNAELAKHMDALLKDGKLSGG